MGLHLHPQQVKLDQLKVRQKSYRTSVTAAVKHCWIAIEVNQHCALLRSRRLPFL